MTTQREYTPPPLPKSAPIQSELTNSAKSKRIPPLYKSHSKDSTSQKHKQLPELQTTTPSRSNNIQSAILPSIKLTPVGPDSYRHIKSASYDEKANGKKRLVDQFYDQLGTPPSSSTRLNTPVLTRNNTTTSFANESRSNLVLNKFEFDKKDVEVEQHNNGNIVEIGEEIEKLEMVIVKSIKEQVELNEDEFVDKIDDFQSVSQDILEIKNRVKQIINIIEDEKYKSFKQDYESFELEIMKFIDFLKILESYELKINNSRDKMNQYKRKLFDIRKTIEFGEMMKVVEHKKLKSRNKWISITFLFGFVLFILYKVI